VQLVGAEERWIVTVFAAVVVVAVRTAVTVRVEPPQPVSRQMIPAARRPLATRAQ
jgi:hypothetical protein